MSSLGENGQPITASSPPISLSGTVSGNSVTLSWSPPSTNGGSPISSYIVTYGPGNNGLALIATSVTITGLTVGTEYTFTVMAINEVDSSEVSGSVKLTPIGVPSLPTSVKVRTDTDSIRVSWSAPASTGGSALLGYRIITRRTGTDTDILEDTAANTTNATLSNLVAGEIYSVRICARNNVGISEFVEFNVTLPNTALRNTALDVSGLAPLLAGTMTRANFKTLLNEQYRNTYVPYVASFNSINAAPLYESVAAGVSLANKNVKMLIIGNGETMTVDTSTLTSNDVLHIPGDAGDAFTLDISGVSYAIAFDASGNMKINGGIPLLPGAQFVLDRTYTVVAQGSNASVVGTVPSAPTSVAASAGNAQVGLSWSAPVSNGGSAITGYTVTNVTTGSTVPVSGTSTVITSLTNGTSYSFTVKAVNAAGSSAPASVSATPVAPITPSTVPCFFGNARVLTPSGYKRMDSLKAGESVMTPEGFLTTIERVKVTVCPAGPNTSPYVIPAGTFGASHRLLISPDHKVCLSDGRRVEAKRLGLVQEEREGTLTYYNIELAGCADMIVGGVAVESLAPVRRVVMSMADFESAIKTHYGGLSASVLANIKRTCRLVGSNAIEVPVLRR